MQQWEYCKLTCDETYIYYTTYQADGPYTVYRPYNDMLWSWCLNTLGLIGWEATGTLGTPTGPAWYFKRILDPSGDFLQL